MKLSNYAKRIGVTYRTAWSWFKNGQIKGAFKTESGAIIVPEERTKRGDYVVIYARVTSSENRSDLDSQAERLKDYAIARGYQIREIEKEVGSGVNDKRPKLQKILREGKATKIIVEHKDRLTRFGFNYLDTLLMQLDCEIEVVNQTSEDKADLMYDLVSIITSFCARYYGLRRSKRETEKIIYELQKRGGQK